MEDVSGPASGILGALSRQVDVEHVPLEEVLRSITEAAAKVLRVARVNVWLYDDQRTQIRCIEAYDPRRGTHESGEELLAADFPSYFKALAELRNVAAMDAEHDPRTSELRDVYLNLHGITAMLDVPILRSGEVIGVVCHEHVGGPRAFESWERFFAGTVGDLIALALESDRRLRAEREQHRLTERLIRMQGLESLATLAAGAAHDFKNLLAVVLGNASVLEEHLDEPRLKQASGDIRSAARRANELCTLLLTYAGQSTKGRRPVSLDPLISEILGIVRVRVPPGVRMCPEVDPLARAVLADPTSLRQVLLNLVVNALDALGDSGTLTVRVRPDDGRGEIPTLDFRVGQGPFVILEVEDDGAGMSPETKARVFEPFFTTKPEGHGFGLASVLGIVRAHGGAIALESEPGQGALFRIWLAAAG